MKTTKARSIVRLAIGLSAIILAWPAWSARHKAAADAPDARLQVFGSFGITPGQTAQINVLVPPPIGDMPGALPPPTGDRPISVGIFFVDGDGSVRKETMVDLVPGGSAALSLNGDDVARSGRIQLHALVQFSQPSSGDPGTARGVVSTVEVIDNATSRTSFVLVPPPVGD